MSREIQAGVEVAQVAKVHGSYKTQFELPHNITTCKGKIIPVKEKKMLTPEKWYVHIHQDKLGNVKTKRICWDG